MAIKQNPVSPPIKSLYTSENISIAILIILHVVGFLGIGLSLMPGLVKLTPINLLVTTLIIFSLHPSSKKKLGLLFGTWFFLGYGIEVIGVNTGMIFGEYSYGPVLGPQLWETPLMIGVNWAMLVYAAGCTVNLFLAHWSILAKTLYATIILVALDYLMEPVAIKLDFWTWDFTDVPMQNYLAWGLIAAVMLFLFFRQYPKATNKVAYAVLIIQFAFFGLLSLTLT